MESRSERICSDETLGMMPQDYDKDCNNYGHILTPPVMSAQIELITTVMVLRPLKQAILQRLQALIQSNRTKAWFTIYLCMFMLLHSCALLTNYQNKQARKYGLKVSR